MALLKPRPSQPTMDATDCGSGHAENIGNVTLAHGAFHGANFADVAVSKLCVEVYASPLGTAVFAHLRHVFSMGRPAQVLRCAAGIVTIAARMSGIVLRARGWAMDGFANEARHYPHLTVDPHHPVPANISREGPPQAFLPSKGQNILAKELNRVAFGRSLGCQRITIPKPLRMMRATPPARKMWLAAIWNRAYSGMSHFQPLHRLDWSGLTRCFQHQISPLFIAASNIASNGGRQ
jgi:hypothetical protein